MHAHKICMVVSISFQTTASVSSRAVHLCFFFSLICYEKVEIDGKYKNRDEERGSPGQNRAQKVAVMS